MSKIKPIQTRYKGYLFRSRLEARWAVFFDALGIKWEYEPEGYDLGVDGWYLPDFWLPEFRVFVEIKRDNKSKHNCDAFMEAVGPILLCVGTPGDTLCTLYTHEDTRGGGGSSNFKCLFVSAWSYKEVIAISSVPLKTPFPEPLIKLVILDTEFYSRKLVSYPLDDAPSNRVILLRDMFTYQDVIGNCFEKERETLRIYYKDKEYQTACMAARSARFEFGENPV